MAAIPAAVGWLYLLRGVGVLAAGPGVPGALPLEQLAGVDDQPVLRLLVVWIPAGAIAGRVLASESRASRLRRVGAIMGLGALVLFVAGALSDAATISDPVPTHLTAQLSRPGTLVAVTLMGVGALGDGTRGRRLRRADT